MITKLPSGASDEFADITPFLLDFGYPRNSLSHIYLIPDIFAAKVGPQINQYYSVAGNSTSDQKSDTTVRFLMSIPSTVFENNLNVAMMYKGRYPSKSIFVSLELTKISHDDFWSDPVVLASLPAESIIVRLSETENSADFHQFQNIFHIYLCPCLVYFGPNSAAISKQWDEFPSPDNFANFFHPKPKTKPTRQAETPAQAAPKPKQTTKILLRGQNSTLKREFPCTAPLSELKEWLKSELGSDYQVIVSMTHSPLPDDDTMTLAEANLTPSAELRVVIGELFDAEVNIDPPEQTPQREPRRQWNCQCGRSTGFMRYVRFALSFINPWMDEDENDRVQWQYRANPDFQRQMIEAARQAARMARQRQV